MFLPVVGIALTVAVTLAAGTSTEAEIDFEVYKPAYMPAGSQLGTPDLLSRKSGEDRISFVEYRLELKGSPNAGMLIAKYEPIYDRYIMSPEKCNVYGVYSGIISPVNNVEESVESLKGSNYSKIERGCSDKIITPGGIELWPHNDNHTSVFYYAKIESSLVILRREYYSGRTGKGHDEAFDEEAIKIFDSLEPLPKKEVRTRQY